MTGGRNHQRSDKQLLVDLPLLLLHHEAAIDRLVGVERRGVETWRQALVSQLHRLPDLDVTPFLLRLDDGVLEGRLQLLRLARGRGEERARAGKFLVYPRGHLADGLVGPVLTQVGNQKGVHFLVGLADTVPDPQFLGQVRHQPFEGVIVDALPHQRDDRKHEACEHEGKKRHDKAGSAAALLRNMA